MGKGEGRAERREGRAVGGGEERSMGAGRGEGAGEGAPPLHHVEQKIPLVFGGSLCLWLRWSQF